jgi:hypothetical protein
MFTSSLFAQACIGLPGRLREIPTHVNILHCFVFWLFHSLNAAAGAILRRVFTVSGSLVVNL